MRELGEIQGIVLATIYYNVEAWISEMGELGEIQGIVLATIYYNVEAWRNISVSEMGELGEVQGITLRKICGQRKTTPYFGLLTELGIWRIKKQIEYKKVMLLHNLLTSNDDRLLKEIVKDQIKDTWPGWWIEQKNN